MASLNLNLPDDLNAKARARAAEGGFKNVEEYVEQLLRADAGESEPVDEELERLLVARLDATGVEMDAADWAQLRRKFDAQVGRDSAGHGS